MMRAATFLQALGWVLLAFAGPLLLAAQTTQQASITLADEAPLIGEPVTATLEVWLPGGAELVQPLPLTAWNGFIVERGALTQRDDANTTIWRLPLVVVFWQTGEVTLPTLSLPYRVPGTEATQTIQTAPHTLTIASVLVAGDTDFRPLPLVRDDAAPGLSIWFLVTVVVLALVSLIVVVLRRRLGRLSQRLYVRFALGIKPLTANELIAELDKVERQRVSLKKKYETTTDLLRRYLSTRLNESFMVRTSEETILRLHQTTRFTSQLLESFEGILVESDPVRYSHLEPSASVFKYYLQRVRAWVFEVEKHIDPDKRPAKRTRRQRQKEAE